MRWPASSRRALPADAAPVQRLRLLNRYFFQELGFAGNVNDYYDRRNSYLNDVLHQRRGIPLTLALLYIELATQLGLTARGVSFPGHFLIKLRMPQGEVVLDPFNGRSLSREDLDERLAPYRRRQGLVGDFEAPLGLFLQAAQPRDVLARMLRNLKEIHRSGATVRLLAVQERLVILLPQLGRAARPRAGAERTRPLRCRRSPTSRPTWPIGRTPKTRWRCPSASTSCGAGTRRACIAASRLPAPLHELDPSQRHTLAWLGLALLAALLLWLLAPVVTPFVVGAVLAYALHPAGRAAGGAPRAAPAGGGAGRGRGAVAGGGAAAADRAGGRKELPLLKAQVPALLDQLDRSLAPWLAQFGIQITFDVASLKAWVAKLLDANMEDWLGTALSSARIGGSAVLSRSATRSWCRWCCSTCWSIGRGWSSACRPSCRRACGCRSLAFLAECDWCSGSTCAASCW